MTNEGTVLVVDDTLASLKLLAALLSGEGYQVRPADSGALALASVAASPPELILLDIRMPVMDGFEVIRQLKAHKESRDIPVIFLSAVTEVELRVEGLKLGAVDFISKPFQREELLARVKTHIELCRLRTRAEKQAIELLQANDRLQNEIAEHKKDEDALRESEEWFRTIFNSASDAIHIHEIGPDFTPGKFIDVNDVACRMLKMSREEILSHSPLDFSTEYHNPPLPEIIQLFTTKGNAIFETGHRRSDGVIVPVEINSHIINLQGKTVMLGIIRDITERKRAEEALKKSQSQLAEAMTLANLVNWEFDVASGIFTFNDRFYALYGTTAEREGGYQMPVEVYAREFVHPDEVGVVSDEVQKGITATDPNYTTQTEHRIIRRDGEIRHIIVRFGITKDADGRTVKTHGANQDITERKRAEMALHQANKQLNLLSSITRHDILNQLMALKGYLELSHDVIDKPETLIEYITKEEQAANTIEAQITFTKNYQELGVTAPEWQSVNASIKKAIAGLPMRAVRVEVDPKNPEIFADRLFEKVFYNLIDNALRYGGAGMKTIRVSSQEIDTGLLIVCEDDGVGITAEDKKRLFTRGFGKHTGLGLFLSREILSITGITITENGTPGKGARFEITVPKGMWRTKGANE